MRTRSLVAAVLAGAALLVPAQVASAQAICDGEISLRGCTGDLFRPCGPLIKCP